ncbi:MAG: hypothetical protein ACJ04Q_06695 [Flavobacteriales bacterium]
MKKIKTNEAIDKELSRLISEDLLPSTCQIFENYTAGEMKPHGSGVFALINGHHILMTASHVTKDMDDERQLFVKIHSGYVSIVGNLQETDLDKEKTIDLAYIILDDAIIKDLTKGYKFVPLSKLRRHNKLLDAMQYCVIGFQEKNRKVEDGKLKPSASAYFLMPSKEKVYEHYAFPKDACFILDFKGKGTDIKTGEKRKVDTHVYGLSGCGLWLILLDHDGEKYTADYRLIGIMIQFRNSKYMCLIGNRIELILEQLSTLGYVKYRDKSP